MTKIKHRTGISFFFILFFMINTFVSCKDDDRNGNIPLVEVYFQINLDDPDYIDLKNIGGWEYINGGSRGIILYRLNNDEIKAYDRHCTFQPSSTCALVSVDATNFTASDVCCGSSFLLNNGSVTRPPASFPLKEYRTSFDGTNLIVSN